MSKTPKAKVLLFLPDGSPVPPEYNPFNIPGFLEETKKLVEETFKRMDDEKLENT